MDPHDHVGMSPHDRITSSTQNEFSLSAIQRHNAFAAREAAATTDRERVQLFAEFIVAESRIRRTKRFSSGRDGLRDTRADSRSIPTLHEKSSLHGHTTDLSIGIVTRRWVQCLVGFL